MLLIWVENRLGTEMLEKKDKSNKKQFQMQTRYIYIYLLLFHIREYQLYTYNMLS